MTIPLRKQSISIISSMAATKKKKGIWFLLFYGYLILLIYFLFFSEGLGRNEASEQYRYNLVFFREIVRFIRWRHILGFKAVFTNVFGNVLAFMPLGFFIPALNGKHQNGFWVVLICFSLSLQVEVIQMITKLGCFDVDDLFLNTLGGMFGYIVYYIMYKMHHK